MTVGSSVTIKFYPEGTATGARYYEGTAIVTCNDSELTLTENQSTYLPLGATHRLENPGKIPLELIEVQSGSYLGEDDILRLDDIYGRDE